MLGAKNSEISIFYFTKLNNYDNDNYRMMQQSTTYHCIFENYVIVLTSDQACNFFFFFFLQYKSNIEILVIHKGQ